MKKAYIKTFNLTFWIVILVTVFLSLLFTLVNKYIGYKTSLVLFFIIHIVFTSYYFTYKIRLTKDDERNNLMKSKGLPPSEFFSEIFPCQLCNTSYFVIPIAIITQNEYLLAFSMITYPLGLVIALLMPSPFLSDDSFFKKRVAGFYITHLYILFMSIVLWNYNFIELRYIHVLTSIVVLFTLCTIAHLLNCFLYYTNITKSANYLFTMHPDGNPILEILKKKINIKLIYVFPLYPVAGLLYAIVIFVARLFY